MILPCSCFDNNSCIILSIHEHCLEIYRRKEIHLSEKMNIFNSLITTNKYKWRLVSSCCKYAYLSLLLNAVMFKTVYFAQRVRKNAINVKKAIISHQTNVSNATIIIAWIVLKNTHGVRHAKTGIGW